MNTIYTKPALAITDEKEEVIGLRTLTSKTFLCDNGEFEIHDGGSPVHYFKDEKWEEIDLNIGDVNGKKVITKAPYKCEIFTNKIGYKFSSPLVNYSMVLVKIGEHEVDNSRFTTHHEGHQLFWDNVFEGINVKVQCYAEKVEAFIEIENSNAPRSFTWKITDAGDHVFTTMGGDMNQDTLEVIPSRTEKINNEYLFTETWTGRVSRISDPKTRIKRWFDDPKFPCVVDPTITIPVAAANDAGVSRSSNLTWYQTGFYFYGENQTINAGVRFQNVIVPAGATINTAVLKVKTISTTGANREIYADKVGNAAAWANGNVPRQITKTTAHTTFTAVTGNSSINVKPQISEIIALGSWASNNAMRFGMLDGTMTGGAYLSDFGSATPPQLIINYTAGVTVAPTLTTLPATTITSTSADGNGDITNTGGANATVRGFAYGLALNPTIAGTHVQTGGSFGVAAFSLPMTGLTPSTLYHYRSFATNSAGTSYGDDVTFTTSAAETSSSCECW